MSRPVVLKVGGPVVLKVAPWGRLWGARGLKNKRDDRGAKQHKGGKNAQPLIDHWVNFS